MNDRERIAAPLLRAIVIAFPDAAGLPAEAELAGMMEVPPDKKMGDYAFPCFRLARALRTAPPVIAGRVAGAFDAPDAASAEALGGYVNFRLNRERFAADILARVTAGPARWGASDEGAGKTVCLDYSSINIAKRFHIGHLSTTMLGHSLKRIYDFLGYRTVGINHLGDWGTQFGKLISAYKRWGNEAEVARGGVAELTRLYVRFHEEAARDPSLEDEGRAYFKAIEDGDAEALRLFNWFKELTLRDCQRVYDRLHVTFDSYAGESFYNDKMGRVIDELREKGLLQVSEGASVVDLSDRDMPPCLILKKDGATLYATRDIAAALYRKDTYDFDKCLYVVAYQQDLHFRQWFAVVEKMGYAWAKDLRHVAFGMISYEGQTLSTRKGHVVYLEELLDLATRKALEIIREKNPELPDKETIAAQVGIGALIYADLQNNRIKDIDFSLERALSFEGETGPYVQYTHARCCSVLRKAEAQGIAADAETLRGQADFAGLSDDFAQDVLLLLSRFPETVAEAALRCEPSMITRAMTEIAKAYNKFYYEMRILDEGEGVRAARLLLTLAVRGVLKNAMFLIGMEAPERM